MRQQVKLIFGLLIILGLLLPGVAPSQSTVKPEETQLLRAMHSISSHTLFDYVKELTSEKYGGRLTGTEGFNQAARWSADLFKKWGLKPAGDKGTYFQEFPIAYTLIFPGCEVVMHIPYKGTTLKKYYHYFDEFIPGSTSGSGEITAEVVYVGYGVTAPELSYDDYQGVDVKGKIVLMEREVPVSPDKDRDLFLKWRPYSFHQYKLENAVAHGAKGMLYNYGPIANPNNSYREGFIYSHVGPTVVKDIFAGTGRTHEEVVAKIKKELKPQSFATGKVFTIKNKTEHHPEGIGYNVLALLEGSDPQLKDEIIIIGAHLDHLGYCYTMIPGANDNASGVAVVLGVAEALAKSPVELKRSVLFILFGSEEQGVVGSQYYCQHPIFPLEKTVAFINMDGVGCGDKLSALAADNYPEFWAFFREANEHYVHREIRARYFANLARPRLDAARFLWKGVPTISWSAFGAPSYYHNPKDDIDTITPEIMEDLAQILFLGVVKMANADQIDFRKSSACH
jgi:hypothetical protein